jgi:hypothetical protein
MLFFAGVKKRPTEALFMPYKKKHCLQKLEEESGIGFLFSLQSQSQFSVTKKTASCETWRFLKTKLLTITTCFLIFANALRVAIDFA